MKEEIPFFSLQKEIYKIDIFIKLPNRPIGFITWRMGKAKEKDDKRAERKAKLLESKPPSILIFLRCF